MRPAVFLDRDGTLVEEVGYLDRLDRLALLSSTPEAVRLLNARGFLVCVVTNQSGVARGDFDEAFVRETHRLLDERLRAAGARVDRYYYCPHHPEGLVPGYQVACACRKPAPGMLRQAERDLLIDLPRSYLVGDRWSDLAAAAAVGATGILVRTGYGEAECARMPAGVRPAVVVADVLDAAAWIVEHADRTA